MISRSKKHDTCVNCGGNKRMTWWLTEYYGVPNGSWCGPCFRRVQHDSNGKPLHPIIYKRGMLWTKLTGKCKF